MILFFDRCLGKHLPEALKKLKPPFTVIGHADRFQPDEPDDQWLKVAGENAWIVITQDEKLHRIEVERAAMIRHQVGAFYLGNPNEKLWNTTRLLFRSFDEMVRLIAETPRPFLFKIDKNGRIIPKNLAETAGSQAAASSETA